MPDPLALIDEAAEWVRRRLAAQPTVGVVLGSGLGAFADTLTDRITLPYQQVPNLPTSSVVGHAGHLCLGGIGDAQVACLSGRVHTYEGHAMDRVVFGVRLLARIGCRAVLLTNAAGGIAATLRPGDLMLVTDHLNLMAQNPLIGPNLAALGPRFPDMTRAYDAALCDAAREVARAEQITLHEGVYAALLGPTYETPAEIRMLRLLGADAVGMSTVPEVIALRHAGVRVGAVSCITNLAAGLSGGALDHREVEATARDARDRFVRLLSGWIERSHRELTA